MHVVVGVVDDGHGRGAAARHRRHRRGMCGFWRWWMIFPLVFWIIPALARADWSALSARAEGAASSLWALSPAPALAQIVSASTGLATDAAYWLVLAAVTVNAAAFVLALRASERAA